MKRDFGAEPGFWQAVATTPPGLLADRQEIEMSVIGYARTSTLHQDAGLEAQIRQLQALGCDKVFSEQVSSVADRARLTAALEYVREGDTFVVTKLDRLARSVAHLVEITVELRRKGVALRSLIWTWTPGRRPAGSFSTSSGRSPNLSARSCWNGSGRGSPQPTQRASTRAGRRPRAPKRPKSTSWP
jgi:Resolvase, N terminal domain